MRSLGRVIALFNRALGCVAGAGLVAMMVATVADMVLRSLGRPLAGSYEVIGWLAAMCTALALGYTQHHRGHVSIDLFVVRLAARPRALIQGLMTLLGTGLFAVVAWRVFKYAGTLREVGSLSETLRVIVYPWVYVVALGCAGLALALLADFWESLLRAFRGRDAVTGAAPLRRDGMK